MLQTSKEDLLVRKNRRNSNRRSVSKPRTHIRTLHTRVKTIKGRKFSSTRWLKRQLNDPYVAAAKRHGYRSRSAYKLMQLNDRFHFLKPDMKVIDLGAAPGGWSQVIAKEIGSDRSSSRAQLISLDILEMEPIPGATVILGDFMNDDALSHLKATIDGSADMICSDITPVVTGHSKTDHLRIIAVLEAAYHFSLEVLAPGGGFVAKVFQGGSEKALLTDMKKGFQSVKHAKPPASRAESSEVYVVAQGFRVKSSNC